MFLGQFGLGFAGKRVAPTLSLGALFLAVQWADLLFWVLALLGVEHFRIQPGPTKVMPFDFYNYPFSHSLAGLVVWGLLFGGAYYLLCRGRAAALVLAANELGVARTGLAMWLFVPRGYWIDRHRAIVSAAREA